MEAADLDSGYPGAAVAGAAIATVCFPLLALIAALMMVGGQPNPRKRKQLRTWAWCSAAWLVVGVLVAISLVSIGTGPYVGSLPSAREHASGTRLAARAQLVAAHTGGPPRAARRLRVAAGRL